MVKYGRRKECMLVMEKYFFIVRDAVLYVAAFGRTVLAL